MRKASELGDLNEKLLEENYASTIANLIREGKDIDEGLMTTLLGGAAGLIVGPIIGKAIAKVLGVTSGVLYDLLVSKAVTAAIGASIANSSVPPVTGIIPPVKK